MYAGLQDEGWANCFSPFDMSFLLRKEQDVTVMTISKLQSLTLVRIIDCTLRVWKKLLHHSFANNNKSNLHLQTTNPSEIDYQWYQTLLNVYIQSM